LVQELPVYYTTKRKMKIPAEKMEFLMTTLLDMTKDQNRITIDGIKIIRDTGWILIRPSGTEPIYRCFAEGPTQEQSDMLCDEGMILIKNTLTQS
ncbi:MAG: phosphoglucosamine mutase, partial [Candidatus Thorarchaeota archaeon]|nr:phosphoglucosamine mutase [Candidatus Thorarchaeota archaeon]